MRGILLEKADDAIAVVAEDAADLPRVMVVIHRHFPPPSIATVLLADGANAPLPCQDSVVLLGVDAILHLKKSVSCLGSDVGLASVTLAGRFAGRLVLAEVSCGDALGAVLAPVALASLALCVLVEVVKALDLLARMATATALVEQLVLRQCASHALPQ